MNRSETSQLIYKFSEAAEKYIQARDQRYRKEERFFSKADCVEYLGINTKTLDKYVAMADVDPKQFAPETQWALSLSDVYKIRDLLPTNLRQTPKFERQPQQKLQVIAIQNQKGGVGKTLSSVSLVSGLASEYHEELRIGLIDLDGQATASMFFHTEGHEEAFSVGDIIRGNYDLDEGETFASFVSDCFIPTFIPNVRLLTASQGDRSVETWFHSQVFHGELEAPYQQLDQIIQAVQDEFDIIILDTPPSLGFMTLNAYFSASSIIFPLSMSEADLDATSGFFMNLPSVWSLMEQAGHSGYDRLNLLITNFKEGSTSTTLLNQASKYWGDWIYPTPFRHSEAIQLCTSLRSTVFDMSKSEYPKTKKTFTLAKQNAFEVVSQVYRDIYKTWDEEQA